MIINYNKQGQSLDTKTTPFDSGHIFELYFRRKKHHSNQAKVGYTQEIGFKSLPMSLYINEIYNFFSNILL